MRAELEAQGDKLVLRVDNQSAKDLTNCWLLVPGKRFDLGAIPRGASWRKIFPLTGANGQKSGTGASSWRCHVRPPTNMTIDASPGTRDSAMGSVWESPPL